MSHFVAYILQFQEIIVYKIPPGGGRGSIASLRSIKEKKVKKREEREKLINDKIEKTIESQKRIKKWMHEKNRELRKIHLEEKKRVEAEKAARKKMEVNLPRDTIKIRPQSAPAHKDVKIDYAKCKGEKTQGYVKDQMHQKGEIKEKKQKN